MNTQTDDKHDNSSTVTEVRLAKNSHQPTIWLTHGSELGDETVMAPVCAVDMLQCNVWQTQAIVVGQWDVQVVDQHHVRVLHRQTDAQNRWMDRQTDRMSTRITIKGGGLKRKSQESL